MKSSDGNSALDFSANIFVCGTKLGNCELIWMKILLLVINMSQKLVVAINQICGSKSDNYFGFQGIPSGL